jgi:uncharacterized protein with HEPN domain
MSKGRDWKVYINDMILGIDRVLDYVNAVESLDDFLNNQMVIDAVAYNFENIGEASNKIPQTIKDKHPDVPWKQMYGLRNFAVHEYHIIDPIIFWEIAEKHLVQNRIDLEKVLEAS